MRASKIIRWMTVATASLAFHAQAQQFLTNGLVAYYPFNRNAVELTGLGNNGMVVNAVLTQDRFGNSLSAYSFNGATTSIQTSNYWPVLGTNAVSVSCWIKYSGGVPQPFAESTMVEWGGSGVFGSRFEFRLTDGGNGTISMCLDGTGNASVASTSLPTNQWMQLVVVKPFNGGLNDTVFHVNGIPAATAQQSDNTYKFNLTTNNSFSIGRGDSATPNRVFDGAIDDVRIYNRALSSNDVTQLYSLEAVTPTEGITIYNNSPVIFFKTAGGGNYLNAASGVNHTLQMTTNLASPVWITVTNAIPFSGFQVTNAPSNAFFRIN